MLNPAENLGGSTEELGRQPHCDVHENEVASQAVISGVECRNDGIKCIKEGHVTKEGTGEQRGWCGGVNEGFNAPCGF